MFISILIYLSISDFFFLAIIWTHQGPAYIYPIIFLGARGINSVILFSYISYKLRNNSNPFVSFSSTTLYYLFSVIGLFGVYFLTKLALNPSPFTQRIHHIDFDDGEATSESLNYNKQSSINFSELREVAPLVDGLIDNDTVTRIAAIQAIAEVDTINLVNALVESRKDISKDVQYHAYEALQKITDRHLKQIDELKATLILSGSDYDNEKEIADIYASLAHVNIEHPILIHHFREEAIRYYSNILYNYSGHRNIILDCLIPVLYENGDYNLCISYCEELETHPKHAHHSREYKARCLFKQRDIDNLSLLTYKSSNKNEGHVP